jgi:hypothetical protein
MSTPQQPELGRSGHTPVVEGQHAKEVFQRPGAAGGKGRQVLSGVAQRWPKVVAEV